MLVYRRTLTCRIHRQVTAVGAPGYSVRGRAIYQWCLFSGFYIDEFAIEDLGPDS
jgi:hypothetical protein